MTKGFNPDKQSLVSFFRNTGSHQKQDSSQGISARGATLVPPKILESKVKLLTGRKTRRAFHRKIEILSERVIAARPDF